MTKNRPELRQIPIEFLQRGQYQPRCDFQPEALAELAESIKSSGLIQPIVVRPKDNNHFEIVAGERRWRAAQLAGLATVDCLVNHYSNEQTAAITTIENVNRVDLNPIEEAQAYQRLTDEFGYVHEEIAAVVGKSRTKITNSLRLLKLAIEVQQFLINQTLSEGHGKVLAGLRTQEQILLAKKCIDKNWNVRKLEQEVKNLQRHTSAHKIENEPNLVFLENKLAEHVGCKVRIDFEENKGQLKIDFHNLEILQGIIKKLGCEEIF